MKQFKLFIWIFALVLIRTVMSVFFNVRGIVPDVLFAFTAAYAVYERNLVYVIWISVICGVLMSAMRAAPFFVIMLVFVYSAAAIYISFPKFNRIPPLIRVIICTVVLTAIGETVMYMVSSLSVNIHVMLFYVLPMAVINAIAAAVIYILLKKCFDKQDITSKLII